MNSVYILKNQYGTILGVFGSIENIYKAINFWIKKFPTVTLAFQETLIDGALDDDILGTILAWKWAYVAPNIDERKFETKGVLPPRKFYNMNLVFAEFENGDYYSL